MPPRRLLAEWTLPAGLACMVVAFAAGSSSEQRLKHVALDARWVVLVAVCLAALASAFRRLWQTRSLPAPGLLRFAALAGAFLGLALLSSAWSVAPWLTFRRAGSLAVLFALGAALAAITADDVRARVRLFQGLAAGAVAVGVLGILTLAFDYDAAVLQDSATSPWRYEGFTENPNTIAILAAAALPLLVGLALRASTRRRQAAWLAGALLMLASIEAAESRGGLLAACGGLLVVVALGVEGLRHRIAAVAAVVLAFAGGTALRQGVQPPAPSFTSQVVAAPKPPPVTSGPGGAANAKPSAKGKARKKTRPKGGAPTHKQQPPGAPQRVVLQPDTKPQALPQEQDEIGHPALSKEASSTAASGRIAAWKGTLELIGDRPILGYGFGTEQKVFVDRWYFFQGGTPENSYLGLLLQVGAVGFALMLVLGLVLGIGGFRALRFLQGDERLLALMQLGVLVAAAGIMLIQSYLYSVGNIASATVWISAFALGPVALQARRRAARVRAAAPEVPA